MWIMNVVAVVLVVFSLLACLANKQVKHYFFQYGFFTRYSTLFGLILFCLPLAATLAPSIAANLFVMNWLGATLVGLTATLYAWAIVYTFRLTWLSVPLRCKLSFNRGENWKAAAKKIVTELNKKNYVIVDLWLATFSIVLAVPLFAYIIYRAVDWWVYNLIGVLLGVLLAFLLRTATWYLWGKNRKYKEKLWVEDAKEFDISSTTNFLSKVSAVFLEVYLDFDIAPAMRIIHKRAAWFALLTCFLVLLPLGVVYHPSYGLAPELPAIVILIALLSAMTSLFGLLGYVFDKDRIPVVLVMLILVVGIQFLIPNKHVYETGAWPDNSNTSSSAALHQRIGKMDESKPVVMVAASGGGSRAALWSTHVMEQLQLEIPQFKEQLGVVSSVSGGSIGQMYFWDKYYFKEGQAPEASSAAESSSLTATVWGLTFLEAPRLLFSSNVIKGDRGWAQEKTWQQLLNQPEKKISHLYENVKNGEWPIPVFNSCFQETGQRFLISPVALNSDANLNSAAKNDNNLNNPDGKFATVISPFRDSVVDLNLDMKLVTAARLSATFPYATPQSQSDVTIQVEGEPTETQKLHAADGGFYDNSGVITILEIIDRFREKHSEESNEVKIALVEIRASSGDFEDGDSVDIGSGGIATEILERLKRSSTSCLVLSPHATVKKLIGSLNYGIATANGKSNLSILSFMSARDLFLGI